MTILQQQLVDEFIEKHKHLFPNLTPRQIEEACKHPFHFAKAQMANNKLPTIKMMYFGAFKVFPGRAKYIKKEVETIPQGVITEERRSELINSLNRIISQKEKEDEEQYTEGESNIE